MQPPFSEAPSTVGLTETLANLNILWILTIIAGLTVLRLAFVYLPSDHARSFAEILESGIIAVALVFLIIRPFVLQAFFIPSPSMEPTLLGKDGAGDRILVNKFAYRLGRPQRGDVVVFLAPPAAMAGDPEFIKRLVGLPGDKIESVAGVVTIGGKPHNHNDVRQALAENGEFGPEAKSNSAPDLQADHHVRFVPDGVLADGRLITKQRLAEIYTAQKDTLVAVTPGYNIRNGEKLSEPFIAEDPDYDMKIFQGKPIKHDHGPYQDSFAWDDKQISPVEFRQEFAQPTEPIPAGQYLMMGDNRNDSRDSTVWGPLEERRVVGKAQLIFWPPRRLGIIH